MNDLLEGVRQALQLLFGGDAETWQIIALSLRVSGLALIFSTLLGVPLGALLGLRSFPGQRLVTTLVYTGMGLPPVVVGLLVYLLLSRAGPLGFLAWLFTPPAMVLAQTLRLQIQSLGATPTQATRTILWEARAGVIVAIVAGFGSIISEVGAVMLVGGNIEGETRVLTTAIVLQTRMGAFDLALALSFVLLAITFVLNGLVLLLQGSVRTRR
jgi:tungstate transport system permease protein